MVRVKHRYLLVNILYPEDDSHTPSSGQRGKLPAIIGFRKPSPSYLTAALLVGHIRSHVSALYGDYGAGMTGSGLAIKYFSQATSTFIVRCPRAHYRLVWASLTYMTSLPRLDAKKDRHTSQPSQTQTGQQCVMRVVRVSGTIRKSEEEAIRRARADILKARRQAAESDETQGAADVLDSVFGTAEKPDVIVQKTESDKSDDEDEDNSDDDRSD